MVQSVKNLPANAGGTGSIPGSERSPEKEMATHCSIPAWEILRIRATAHGVAKELDTNQ